MEEYRRKYNPNESPRIPTERQLEVLQLLANGIKKAEIIRALGITEHTITNHVKHSLKRMHAKNRTHAVTIAIRKGWIS